MKLDGEQGVVAQFLLDCGNRGLADGTVALYRRQLGLVVGYLQKAGGTELEDVTVAQLRQFLQYLLHPVVGEKRFPNARHQVTGKLAPSTVVSYVLTIKAFFGWCLVEELIKVNPSARLSKPKIPERVVSAFTPDHIDRMLGVCDTSTVKGFRDYVLLLVLLDTGIRVSELCGLRLQDVHPRYIKVFGKGQKEREIGMHSEVGKLLWKYIQKYRGTDTSKSDHVFLSKRGALTVSGVEDIFRNIKIQSGITDVRVSPHTFRHTFAKWYLMRGGDLFKLSRELGHSGVQITGEIYLADFKSADARQDHEAFSPVGQLNLNAGKRSKLRSKK
jgi:integrase/recombinase XerD